MSNEADKPKKIKLGRTARMILAILAAYAAVVAVVATVADGRHVRFYLTGAAEIRVPYGEPYAEPGCYAVSTGRLTGEGETPLTVTTEGQVDTDTLGTYTLRYSAQYRWRRYSTQRIVHVEDMTPPQIILERREGYEPSWFTGYEEEGFKALDDVDGDLSDKVKTRVEEEKVVYIVHDAAGNSTRVERQIPYAVGKPRLTLEGGESLTVSASLQFNDPGCRAVDDLGNDLSEHIKIEGEVIPYQPGTYTRSYTITNELGSSVSVQRQITVEPVRNPDAVQPDGYTIYLTFDDGPGPYTARLLDVLAKYNVKATFFVTCLHPDYQDLVGRAYREGHSIGVHTASHNYYSIYASEQAYLEDFQQVEEMILAQTGEYSQIFRFPGGSSNTVSSFNPGIMSRLARTMSDLGYRYFDWNVTSGDAGGTTKTESVVANVVEGCIGKRNAVVLQHDVKDFSVAAVERIIVWGLNSGFTFRPLDVSSPEVHHGIAN